MPRPGNFQLQLRPVDGPLISSKASCRATKPRPLRAPTPRSGSPPMDSTTRPMPRFERSASDVTPLAEFGPGAASHDRPLTNSPKAPPRVDVCRGHFGRNPRVRSDRLLGNTISGRHLGDAQVYIRVRRNGVLKGNLKMFVRRCRLHAERWVNPDKTPPHLSDRPENVCEQRLLLQHKGETMHQRTQPGFRHRRDQIVEHAALTEQRTDAALQESRADQADAQGGARKATARAVRRARPAAP